MANILQEFEQIVLAAQQHLWLLGSIIFFTFIFNILNWSSKSYLLFLGLVPRSVFGLIGIVFSPFLHGNFNHLFFNSIPFFVLSFILLGINKELYLFISLMINLSECLIVWLFGRKKIHIGASGIISGYFGFLLGLAYFQPTIITLIIAFIMLYYFGAILFGLFPSDDRTSWESHLAGFVSGVALVYLLKHSNHFQKLYYIFKQNI